jgi:hypothetical protein
LRKLESQAHITQYNKTMTSQRALLVGACRPDFEISPDLINNTPEIKMRIKALSKPFGLSADLTQDNGFSFAYQLSLFFPTHF